MPFALNVPTPTQGYISISIEPGQSVFVLGANGSGKSSLMHMFFSTNAAVRRITAHRQTWFQNSVVTVSADQKSQMETSMRQADLQSQARWQDQYATLRPGISIYEVIDAE